MKDCNPFGTIDYWKIITFAIAFAGDQTIFVAHSFKLDIFVAVVLPT